MKPDPEAGSPLSPPRPAWTALACALIVAAGIAVYSNSFKAPFLFDDHLAIQGNRTLLHFPAWENLTPPQVNPISRRPVVNFTLALNGGIGGLSARSLHFGNLLIHLLAALTLFGVVRRTLLMGQWPAAAPTAVAFAVALIWTVHPLQTEAVTYLTQRTELLMGLFFLLTLYCSIRAFTIPGTKELRMANGQLPIANSQLAIRNSPFAIAFFRRFWFIGAVIACALGMGSKEVMAVAPIVVLLYDRCFLSGSFREAFRRRLGFYLGLAATWAILGAMLIAYPWGEKTGAGFGIAKVGPWEYARTQPGVILNYLRLCFWPSGLCLDYGWPIATSAWQIVPAAAAMAALLAGALWALRRAPWLGFLGASFFLILAPSSSFVPIIKEIAAERRMYLPLAAIVTACVVAAGWLGDALVRRLAESDAARKLLQSVLAAVALLAAAVALGCATFERNAQYRTAVSIWQDTAAKRPLNSAAQNNLGAAYLDAGRPVEAIERFNKAIELLPDDAAAYDNRAAAFLCLGRYGQALADADKAIALEPDFGQAYDNRGSALLLTQRVAEAVQSYDTAVALTPDDPEPYDNRANARLLLNRPAEAIPDCDRAIALKPDFADAYNTRASAYLRTNRFDLALRDCDRAIELRPDSADAYLNRASAHYQLKDYDGALSDLKTYERLGGQPKPEFLKSILRAGGRPGS